MAQQTEFGTSMSGQKPVWIIGYMGSGKSTVGNRLAVLLKRPFVDSDQWIEEQTGKTVAEIFEQDGEAAFRGWERRFVEQQSGEGQIVSCGGGLPCFHRLMNQLLGTGTVIYLQASVETLVRNLRNETQQRPLLKTLPEASLPEFIGERLEERRPVYERAHATVAIDGKTLGEIVQEAIELLRN